MSSLTIISETIRKTIATSLSAVPLDLTNIIFEYVIHGIYADAVFELSKTSGYDLLDPLGEYIGGWDLTYSHDEVYTFIILKSTRGFEYIHSICSFDITSREFIESVMHPDINRFIWNRIQSKYTESPECRIMIGLAMNDIPRKFCAVVRDLIKM